MKTKTTDSWLSTGSSAQQEQWLSAQQAQWLSAQQEQWLSAQQEQWLSAQDDLSDLATQGQEFLNDYLSEDKGA